jgi:hypothetical protein
VRAGDANDPHSTSPELHAYLRDGERVGFMAERSRPELLWVAYHLSQALAKLSPVAKPAWARTPVVGAGPGAPVLPYGRDTASSDISIHTFPDGGVAVSIPPTRVEKWIALAPLVPLVFFASVASGLLGAGRQFRLPAAVVIAALSVVTAVVLARLALVVARWGQPLVVGVDPSVLYVETPSSFRRRRSWPRHWVSDVRLITERQRNAATGRYVEVVLTGRPPLKLCGQRGDWDRKRVAAVLRRAAGLLGPPPEDVKRNDGKKR